MRCVRSWPGRGKCFHSGESFPFCSYCRSHSFELIGRGGGCQKRAGENFPLLVLCDPCPKYQPVPLCRPHALPIFSLMFRFIFVMLKDFAVVIMEKLPHGDCLRKYSRTSRSSNYPAVRGNDQIAASCQTSKFQYIKAKASSKKEFQLSWRYLDLRLGSYTRIKDK